MLTKFQNVYPRVGGVYVGYPGNALPPIPPWTVRLRYSGNKKPTFSKGNAVQIDADENIWDLTYENEDWTSLVNGQNGSYQQYLVEVIGSNSSGVTNMNTTFSYANCKKITQLDTSNVSSMRGIFYNTVYLEEMPLIDTSNVKDMYWAFWACKSLKELPPIDTSNVSSMRGAFRSCQSISSFPALNTQNVKFMDTMFADCSGLKSIPTLDTTNVVECDNMFINCINVESGISSFYNQLLTSPVTSYGPGNYHQTFKNCGISSTQGSAELAQIPSGWK
jgi:hypothetical protein